MTEDQRKRAAEVAAKWRLNNPEKYKEQQAKYVAKNSAMKAEKTKLWREKNPEKFAKSRDAWLVANKEKVSKMHRKACLKHYYANTEKYVAHVHKRRVAKMERSVSFAGEFDALVFDEAARVRNLRKVATGIEWHIDHMIPLKSETASGLHVGVNIQVIPARLNIAKSNRMICTEPCDWLSHI